MLKSQKKSVSKPDESAIQRIRQRFAGVALCRRRRYKDYRHHAQQKTMTLQAANRYREQKLAHCRDLLGMPALEPTISKAGNDYRNRYEQLTGSSLWKCPVCHQGRMLMIEILPQSPRQYLTPIKDTS